jgi:hypothetical protein
MASPLSRALSSATAAYGVYALARPAHLWQGLQAEQHRAGLELLARTFGVRDLAISSLGLFGRSDRAVRTAMALRIAMDLGDCALLATWTDDEDVRKKVLAVTLGWASLNALALAVDRARD